MGDFDAYWQAGQRIVAGEPLYFTPADHADPTIYRYAPWFAWAWAPLTFLPYYLVQAVWAILLAAAGWYAVWRVKGHPVIFLLGPSMLAAVWYGNVQALMLAGLVFGLERRSGPAWIALAASLKAVPLLLVLVYLGRREWSKAAWTLGLTAALVAPMLLYDLSAYPAAGQMIGLAREAPLAWGAGALLGAGLTLHLARTRYAWLAASATVLLALPRFAPYELSLLLPAVSRSPEPTHRASRPEPHPR